MRLLDFLVMIKQHLFRGKIPLTAFSFPLNQAELNAKAIVSSSLLIFTCLLLCSVNVFAAEQSTNAYVNQATVTSLRSANEKLIQVQGQLQSINEELSSQRAILGRLRSEVIAQGKEKNNFNHDLLKEIKALRRQNQSLLDNLYENNKLLGGKSDMKESQPLRNYDLQTPDGKMYFGEDEYIYVKEADATFDARIDTGAAVSSISAQDITEFERGGKRWYRFNVEANDHLIKVEAPFVRHSIIKQSSSEETTQRIVVSLNLKIGNYSASSDFTLIDRSHMQYPMLIGRSMIQDIAVVDVARDHVQGRNKDTYLILKTGAYKEALKKGLDPNAEYKAKQAATEGQIAYPTNSYGSNLGSNSENALPAVRKNRTSSTDAPAVEEGKTEATLEENN